METTSEKTKKNKYSHTIVFLHWFMALALILMLACGFAMTNFDLDKSLKFQLFQIHKSSGVILLWLFFIRLAARLFSRVPPLPDTIKKSEAVAAKAGHFFLYFLMFALPMSGWALVSSSVYGLPTIVFGLFEWPHIPGIQADEEIHELAEEAHFVMALTLLVLILGHVGAVLKHAHVEKENLLPRMSLKKRKASEKIFSAFVHIVLASYWQNSSLRY